ncbi:MAG: hypothetical protein HY900_34065 [Deltaproteobacteria bacterium]|nr:hypothetical protein [Deltaproteobacteria bacterium]
MNQQVPTADELKSAVLKFDEEWGAVDKVLYSLCGGHPGHDSLKHVIAKVVLIGRTYAAGIERCVQPRSREQSIVLVGKHLYEHGETVDEIISSLPRDAEPLDPAAMQCIVEEHGRLTTLLRPICRGSRSPRSFVSKYLHFHHPAVPIYDSLAATALTGLVPWPRRTVPFEGPPAADETYWEFCVRLVLLLSACRDSGHNPTPKELDAFLLQAGILSA